MDLEAKKESKDAERAQLANSGIAEFDVILRGGFPRGRMCLVQGPPGSGKTTLALQFLLAGAELGEKGVYVTFSETAIELEASANSHGWSLSSLSIVEFIKMSELSGEDQYTVFHSADVELVDTTKAIVEKIKALNPRRLVLDSLTELRMIARDPLRYRRQILTLKQAIAEQGCTVLFLDDQTTDANADLLLESIAHGVIQLTSERSMHGGLHRRLEITKMRGVDLVEGAHDFRITKGGIRVFPRLLAALSSVMPDSSSHGPALVSGIRELDDIIGGPIPWGFGIMIVGPPGIGKSSLAARFAVSAAQQGKKVCMYSFEESMTTLLRRCKSLGIDLADSVSKGQIGIQRIDPSRVTPGQLTYAISTCIENNHGGMVVIDSLNGYLQAMSSDRSFVVHLHELLSYLNAHGVTTILVSAQHGVLNADQANFEATYLADLVILLRYFEALGVVRQAISVIKNRAEEHERTIREFQVGKKGIRIGSPLQQFQGVLTGVPMFAGKASSLIREKDESRKQPEKAS